MSIILAPITGGVRCCTGLDWRRGKGGDGGGGEERVWVGVGWCVCVRVTTLIVQFDTLDTKACIRSLFRSGRSLFRSGRSLFRSGRSLFRSGRSLFHSGRSLFRFGHSLFRSGHSLFRSGRSSFRSGRSLFRFGRSLFRSGRRPRYTIRSRTTLAKPDQTSSPSAGISTTTGPPGSVLWSRSSSWSSRATPLWPQRLATEGSWTRCSRLQQQHLQLRDFECMY